MDGLIPEDSMEKEQLNSGSKIKNVIAVMSGKGGVGKSSVSALLAASLNKKGFKVGIMDADITGPSIPMMFGVNESLVVRDDKIFPPLTKTGIKIVSVNLLLPNEDDPVIWRAPILNNTIKQFWSDITWGELDYLVIDMPPGTGDIAITVLGMLPLDGIVMVSSPQELAQMVVRKALKMSEAMNVPILGLVENMSYAICPNCNEKHEVFGPSKGKELAEAFDIPFIGALPLDPELSQLSDEGNIEAFSRLDEFNLGEIIDNLLKERQ